jgi:hypothetical protein
MHKLRCLFEEEALRWFIEKHKTNINCTMQICWKASKHLLGQTCRSADLAIAGNANKMLSVSTATTSLYVTPGSVNKSIY